MVYKAEKQTAFAQILASDRRITKSSQFLESFLVLAIKLHYSQTFKIVHLLFKSILYFCNFYVMEHIMYFALNKRVILRYST